MAVVTVWMAVVTPVTMPIGRLIVVVWTPITTMPVPIRYLVMAMLIDRTAMPVPIRHPPIGYLVMAMSINRTAMPVPIGHPIGWFVDHSVARSICRAVRWQVRNTVNWMIGHTISCIVGHAIDRMIRHTIGWVINSGIGRHLCSHCRSYQRRQQHRGSKKDDLAHSSLALSRLKGETPPKVQIRRPRGSKGQQCGNYVFSIGIFWFAAPGGGQRIVATPVVIGTDSHPVGLPLPTDSRPQWQWPSVTSEKANQQPPQPGKESS